MISPDEVYILLSYIPFKTHDQPSTSTIEPMKSPKKQQRQSSFDSAMNGEGMYNR